MTQSNHASDVLYPAIGQAMEALSTLPIGFNDQVNRAFNVLHGAFWSECPAPASAEPLRPEVIGCTCGPNQACSKCPTSGEKPAIHADTLFGGLAPHEQRVLAERAELDERFCKLLTFIDTRAFVSLPMEERHRMHDQADAMAAYRDALDARIHHFKPATEQAA